ncbi:F0F1 ATP synthase subunit B, partial [Staphylococcus aureus]|uniref:F0F1 ATP synthase subunit B n=1 Tax=Staphylococcus aureus TaxID=1280 RepID=UPI00210991EE
MPNNRPAAGGVEWGTVIVQVLTFIVLLSLLKKFAWCPLKDVMDKRERDINRDIDDAEQAKLNAQKLEEENKQKLKETREEVQKILEDAKVQARQQQEQTEAELRERRSELQRQETRLLQKEENLERKSDLLDKK